MYLFFDICTFLVIICLFLVGYVYPFVVGFRGGSVQGTVVYSWGLSILLIVFLCVGIPEIAGLLSWKFREQVFQLVPHPPHIVPILCGGWMTPLVGGGLGRFVRRFALKWFPIWMNRISFHDSLNGRNGPENADSRKE